MKGTGEKVINPVEQFLPFFKWGRTPVQDSVFPFIPMKNQLGHFFEVYGDLKKWPYEEVVDEN